MQNTIKQTTTHREKQGRRERGKEKEKEKGRRRRIIWSGVLCLMHTCNSNIWEFRDSLGYRRLCL